MRYNWAIKPHAKLAVFPAADGEKISELNGATESLDLSSMTLRVERQCLFRLADSDAIVFTILVTTEPLPAFFNRTNGEAALLNAIQSLSQAQLAYKGMTAIARRLTTLLG